MDDTWPEARCCRIYSDHSFTGASFDLCLGDVPGDVETYIWDLAEDKDLWGDNWYKEISSIKCGKEVEEAKFWRETTDATAIVDSMVEMTSNRVCPQDTYV